MKSKELDKRQRSLAKMLREVDERGEAKLDLIFKDSILTGLTTALRQEERASRENEKMPAICRVDTHKIGAYVALQGAAGRWDAKGGNYPEVIRNITRKLSGEEKRAVCFCFDHAGGVKGEVMEKIFRSADDVAYNLDVSLHLIFVITKVQKWDNRAQDFFPQWPTLSELIKPRWRTFEYSATGLKYLGDRRKFDPFDAEAPLLDSEDRPAIRIA